MDEQIEQREAPKREEKRGRGKPIDMEKVQKGQNALVLTGGNVKAAAGLVPCQPRTLQKWIDKGLIDPSIKVDGAEHLATLEQLTQDRNEKLAANMLSVAEQAVEQMPHVVVDASLQQLATSAGILIQNSQLLQGKATARVELNVTDNLEILRKHGLLIEAEAEVIDAEVVEKTD